MSEIICGDCIEQMKELDACSVDSVVSDPPYGLSFMGRSWDDFEPKEYQKFSEEWGEETFRVLKPGGYLLAFSGTRTYHRMVVGLEDAGFVIKDQIDWLYGTGFPKSTNISKQIDKKLLKEKLEKKLGHKPTKVQFKQALNCEREKIGENPNERPNCNPEDNTIYEYGSTGETKGITANSTSEAERWEGWGTALKPAHEPIVVAQKPRDGTYAENVLEFGVGGLNIDACRINPGSYVPGGGNETSSNNISFSSDERPKVESHNKGRFPANVVLDEKAAMLLDEQSGVRKSGKPKLERNEIDDKNLYGNSRISGLGGYGDSGGASRFFYSAKARKGERNAGLEDLEDVNMGQSGGARQKLKEGKDEYQQENPSVGLNKIKKVKNDIATLKPINLMRWLVRLVTPSNGTVLDPFAGSGTTGCACEVEGFDYILIEKRERFADVIAPRRCEYWSKEENWSDLKDHEELEDPVKKKVYKLEAFE